MKNLIIKASVGTFVLFTFVIYSLHQRSEGSQAASNVAKSTPASSTSVPTSQSTSTQTGTQASTSSATYKDGSYTGKSFDAIYGYIQVRATISGGKLTDITFLDYPQDRRDSIEINQQAMPMLKSEAIAAQSAKVDGVSGATDTSAAFEQSLDDALTQARA